VAGAIGNQRMGFLEPLVSGPDVATVDKFSKRPEAVLRALGFSRSTREQSSAILNSLVRENSLPTLMQTLTVVPVPLTPEQVQKVFLSVLKEVKVSKSSDELEAVTNAIPPLAVRLSGEQAAEAFTIMQEGILNATDSAKLHALTNALPALSARLTPEQAQI